MRSRTPAHSHHCSHTLTHLRTYLVLRTNHQIWTYVAIISTDHSANIGTGQAHIPGTSRYSGGSKWDHQQQPMTTEKITRTRAFQVRLHVYAFAQQGVILVCWLETAHTHNLYAAPCPFVRLQRCMHTQSAQWLMVCHCNRVAKTCTHYHADEWVAWFCMRKCPWTCTPCWRARVCH